MHGKPHRHELREPSSSPENWLVFDRETLDVLGPAHGQTADQAFQASGIDRHFSQVWVRTAVEWQAVNAIIDFLIRVTGTVQFLEVETPTVDETGRKKRPCPHCDHGFCFGLAGTPAQPAATFCSCSEGQARRADVQRLGLAWPVADEAARRFIKARFGKNGHSPSKANGHRG